ncbi:CHAP domain-containing protein [Nonomuraea polychroma]|uniref:CHAP domain-containing protein n=1 Tax=Nonomuraea polychroma TaxID=46176 RepID=A0A438MAK5_9ACTN|nr:CHAP domain-containing protein [Nonomuraea polychroma]RVX42701.1 CHAP domain-containing protein [Nonomuraea polychroma]
MTKHVLSRTLMPANLSLLAAGVTIAAGALLAGAPAFADHQGHRQANAPQAAQQKPATADAILKIAESQMGVTENAAGGGTPFHSWYMASQRAKETVARDGGSIQAYANAPWCAMFVSWVGEKAGARPTIGWDAYTITWAKWFQKNGHWGTQAKPGAVVYFSWDDKSTDSIDHMGLVKKDNGDGTITTVEGNTGNGKVEQRIRPTSQVVGYGYPQYNA